MQAFDLIIRNANVVTAADGFLCDIGVRDGRIVALGLGLQGAAQEVDARGRIVTPGGSTAMCIWISRPATVRSWPTTSKAAPDQPRVAGRPP